MSGSISLSKSEPDIWIMAGWVFRLLIEPLLAEMDENDIDFAEVNQSYHLQTFPFELFEPVQARRIAGRLARVCGEVREEMLATPPEESRHRQNMQVADLLAELGPRLQEFAESDPPDAR